MHFYLISPLIRFQLVAPIAKYYHVDLYIRGACTLRQPYTFVVQHRRAITALTWTAYCTLNWFNWILVFAKHRTAFDASTSTMIAQDVLPFLFFSLLLFLFSLVWFVSSFVRRKAASPPSLFSLSVSFQKKCFPSTSIVHVMLYKNVIISSISYRILLYICVWWYEKRKPLSGFHLWKWVWRVVRNVASREFFCCFQLEIRTPCHFQAVFVWWKCCFLPSFRCVRLLLFSTEQKQILLTGALDL